MKLLIAIDGSENAMRAVRYVADLARRGHAIDAVLFNVQPPVMSGEIFAVAPIELAELVLGSVSHKVARKAMVPVTLVN